MKRWNNEKIKLVDIETNEEEVEFGTCELCFSTGLKKMWNEFDDE